MRSLLILLATLVLATPVARAQTPVVLELFTSQGCSSCPPADALLAELASREGVIALALHVDYWDYLGWKDSFASPSNTARQRAYAKAVRSRTIFTPEIVVQGAERLKGHDAEGILKEIARHQTEAPLVDLSLARDGDTLKIHVAPKGEALGPAMIELVNFLPSAGVSIEGGENAGRTVNYKNIVTRWETIARWDGTTPVDMRYEGVEEGPVAVIVQRTKMGPVLTAAQLP